MAGTANELLGLIREIQELRLELERLRRLEGDGAQLQAKERTLDQLRWRLAVLARRAANDLGAAA
jgi:hypothetical protein